MADLQLKVVGKFMGDNTPMFYGRYVDDTLVAIKPEDWNHEHNELYNFNLNF